ncbi:Crp/Fnr family transcriptional regulator [Aliifodinibius sp. S!AR15-10]|uniref:Crp/Fnr family transcriptional regulator n=1 Tax=Aliifodinibius sp. S!AR15-10 TaxID=2950437 RepID=UPI0028647609|nr:Crp/Fnr family transcriptional regulator [Aliifodinibius sp. S!AR15-10]MDR8393779.1 Crp/Fnr family transcriptional regulator [Aliifodinibius sp. S!AR15-10]
MTDEFLSVFSKFNKSKEALHFIERSSFKELPEQSELLHIGAPIQVVPFVLDGAVKVLRQDDAGHELFLYHIHPGESCAMTLTSTLSREKSQVKAVTLEKTKLVAMPVSEVHHWYSSDPVFREFVLATFQQRFEELLKMLDQIAFQQIDSRLQQLLAERSEALERKILHITHQELAEELNSSREVVSRLLKQMEKNGMVELGRNRIKIIDLV